MNAMTYAMNAVMHAMNAVVLLALRLVEQPDAVEPPGVGPLVTQFSGYLVWGGGAGMLIGVLLIGIKMSVGRSGRSQMAASALGDLPYVFGGGLLVVSAAALVTAVVG